MLDALIPSIVSAATVQMKEKSVKVRTGVYGCLKELLITREGALSDHAASVVASLG